MLQSGQYGAMKDLLATVDDAGYLRAFTSLARRLLATAGDEAQRMGAAEVRTVHLVYALVNEPEGLAMLVLTMMGVDPAEVTTAIEAAAPAPIVDVPRHVPFAAESHTVFRVALEEALAMHHKEIGSGHLLLGVLDAPATDGARALASQGVAGMKGRAKLRALIQFFIAERARQAAEERQSPEQQELVSLTGVLEIVDAEHGIVKWIEPPDPAGG